MIKRPNPKELAQRIKESGEKEAIYKKLTRYSVNEVEVRLEKPEFFESIITADKKMFSIFQDLESLSLTSQPVLITGETGVGKELIAKAIHSLSGLKGKLVAVNAAGLDDFVFSDTLFGHAKGAYTGADQVRDGLIKHAAGGTLFLDEIGDLSLVSQVKLLRLLQEGEYLALGMDELKKANVRIVASTNQDLWALQKAGQFRKDLNFRIRTHHVHIPPLRERTDDIRILVDHFLDNAALTLNKKKPACTKELFALLKRYDFPGNIRELQTMIFDAVSKHKGRVLSPDTFKKRIHMSQKNGVAPGIFNPKVNSAITFSSELPTIKQATHLLIAEALKRVNGNQSIAARMLGISQPALSKRLKSSSKP
ncbi:MAG: sigma 54-interacting transcriptional regulator [Proteobacteria bacterium]|nr:sigma 54-interacting transcriptional regulator [Pseudomonadota bacterium]